LRKRYIGAEIKFRDGNLGRTKFILNLFIFLTEKHHIPGGQPFSDKGIMCLGLTRNLAWLHPVLYLRAVPAMKSVIQTASTPLQVKLNQNRTRVFFTLKGQSHEKFGEMRVWGLSLGHN
jgi:hypothetical protein